MKKKATVILGFSLLFLMGIVLMGRGSIITQAIGGELYTFMPIVMKPLEIDPDMLVTAVEVNQAVQRANNSVPLVTDRDTIVRVYAISPEEPVNNVVVRLTAHRGGSQIGQLNSAPTTIPQSASRANPNSTVNFNLPFAWLSGNVTLTAKVDANNSYPAEANENNNTLVRDISFTSVPNLQIQIVPINYTHQGPSNPGFYPAQPFDYISDWIERVYPIADTDITIHANYNFQGNLQNIDSWLRADCDGNGQNCIYSGLLQEMYILKLLDNVPEDSPIVYYAFVPTSNGATTWFSSGVAGIGWIGYRESVGLNLGNNDQTGSLAGHEVGHNLDRRHAPCGNPSGVDPSYPYAGASIGEYGIDVPQLTYYTPADATDFMSYCDPAWVSDYTYVGLFNDQMIHGRAPERAFSNSMLVTAGFSESGAVRIGATYAFDMVPSLETGTGDYFVELLDSAGEVIARHELQQRLAQEEMISIELLTAVVPLPETAADSLRIVNKEGEINAARSLHPAQASRDMTAVATQEGDTIRLTWSDEESPALVRYTPDGGQTWQGLGVGVTSGEFIVDAQNLTAGADGRFEIILPNTGSPAILTAEMP